MPARTAKIFNKEEYHQRSIMEGTFGGEESPTALLVHYTGQPPAGSARFRPSPEISRC